MVNTGLPLESTYPYAGTTFGTGYAVPSVISNCSNHDGFYKLTYPNNNSRALWYRFDDLTPS